MVDRCCQTCDVSAALRGTFDFAPAVAEQPKSGHWEFANAPQFWQAAPITALVPYCPASHIGAHVPLLVAVQGSVRQSKPPVTIVV